MLLQPGYRYKGIVSWPSHLKCHDELKARLPLGPTTEDVFQVGTNLALKLDALGGYTNQPSLCPCIVEDLGCLKCSGSLQIPASAISCCVVAAQIVQAQAYAVLPRTLGCICRMQVCGHRVKSINKSSISRPLLRMPRGLCLQNLQMQASHKIEYSMQSSSIHLAGSLMPFPASCRQKIMETLRQHSGNPLQPMQP